MAVGADDFCTVAELKECLPSQGANDDTTLQNLITRASSQILQLINRPHILASVLGALTENYDGNGSSVLLPKSYPITAVTSVTVDTVPIPLSTSALTAGFLFDARRIMLRGFRFHRGLQNVILVYAAGYAAMPLDLKQAAIESFALAYRQRSHIGEKSNSMNGQVTVSYDMSAIPDRSMSIFQQYIRRTPVS